MTDLSQSALGRPTSYPDRYDARLLFTISRKDQRAALPGQRRPLRAPVSRGVDIWTAYELSWLNRHGKPEVACATIEIPADTAYIIESKSLKLYLGSFNQTQFESSAEVADILCAEVSSRVEAQVRCRLHRLETFSPVLGGEMDGICLDGLDVPVTDYEPNPATLRVRESPEQVQETVVSHLFRSLCPVTGQPDYASVQISYRGALIDHAGLLRYLISYRLHAGFHELCVERIFLEILNCCDPEELSVFARFARRGGIDISPFRTTVTEGNFLVPKLIRSSRPP